jgi:magnesium-protoporphyrin O-methyltransferase
MNTTTYDLRRSQLETYFDRTAAEAWSRLTSDAPVSRIRATVRAGRERMRSTLLGWLPADLRGARLLDAGCGTGALAIEAAQRGAQVVAIDVAASLVELARRRTPADVRPGHVEFLVGDMLDRSLGQFDFVVAMDSLIHYAQRDIISVVSSLSERTDRSVLFTFAPRTPALSVMHAVGRFFPSSNRAPAIQPVGELSLRRKLGSESALEDWSIARTERIASGFYTSQAIELTRT